MSNHRTHEPPFPRFALIAGALLVAFSISLALVGRLTGFGRPDAVKTAPVATRDLTFVDGEHGTIIVRDAHTSTQVATLAPGTNGFVRVVMRSIARHRKLEGMGSDEPFRLTEWEDGQLSIEDRVTGQIMRLDAFGAPNKLAFARLLNDAGKTR